MECPNCKSIFMVKKKVDDGPEVMECSNCGGFWVKSFEYWKWKSEHSGPASQVEITATELKSTETNFAKICPECSKILHRYEVGKGMDFSLDRCNSCRGIWFDKNEWHIIKSRGLDKEINKIFGLKWQNEVLQQKLFQGQDKVFQNILGPEEFEELKKIKSWIDSHKNRAEIMAFLSNKREQ